MLLVDAWVGPSKIHGLGLISHQFIPEGAVIWRLDPTFDLLLTEHDFCSLPEHTQRVIRHYGFYYDFLCRWVLSADDDRFTNHSDTPNAQFRGDHSVAVADIHEGDEITDDYQEFSKPISIQSRPDFHIT